MRTAFLYNSERFIGGGEIGFTELVRQAGTEPGMERLVLVPAPGEVSATLDKAGIPCLFLPMPSLRGAAGPWRWLAGATALVRCCRAEGVDLVHANGARCMLYAGLAARWRGGPPALWHVRVMERDGFADRLRAAWAAAIVCNSKAVAATVAPFCRQPDKIRVVYNGVDQKPFATAPAADLRAEFGIAPERRIVLVAALLTEWKGQRDVVRALGLLPPPVRERLCVVFAGRELTPGTPFTLELKRLAAELGVAGSIVWAGLRQDLPALMRAADLLLLPSHGEPFGRVIIEAWAAGLPVLATETGGAGEIIEDGRTGRLIPEKAPAAIAKALPEMLDAPRKLAEFADNGRRRALDFTLERHAAQMFALYREIAGRG